MLGKVKEKLKNGISDYDVGERTGKTHFSMDLMETWRNLVGGRFKSMYLETRNY